MGSTAICCFRITVLISEGEKEPDLSQYSDTLFDTVRPYMSLNARHTPTIILQTSSAPLLMLSGMGSSLRRYAHERLRPVLVAA